MGKSLGEAAVASCNKFKEANKIAPKRMVIYREGVSESQLEIMLSTEVSLLKEAVEKAFPGIQIVFLVCNSMVNARFY